MTLINVSSLQVGNKANIRLVILDISSSPYSGGMRTKGLGKDEEGSTIEIVGFNDVHELCSQLSIGNTYIFNDISCSTFQQQMQIKIHSFSSIHHAASSIDMTNIKIKDLESQNIDDFVNLSAIVSQCGDTAPSANGKSTTRRMTLVDDTSSVNVCAINAASELSFSEGTIVNVRARI